MNGSSETAYTSDFYQDFRAGSRRSASVVAPILLQLIRPSSVVDVGCGMGTWLAAFRELGVEDVLGLDGDYVERAILQIPQDRFIPTDLAKPFAVPRNFDLALSLEVAEHLPVSAAGNFVRSLTRLAPVVVFSAAIPFQGGIHHLNEQWPDYWARLFKQHQYSPIDCIRGKIWSNEAVEYWYAQNTLLFASEHRIQEDPVLLREYSQTHPDQLSLVHPKKYLEVPHVKRASRVLADSLRRSAWRRLQRRLKRRPSPA